MQNGTISLFDYKKKQYCIHKIKIKILQKRFLFEVLCTYVHTKCREVEYLLPTAIMCACDIGSRAIQACYTYTQMAHKTKR